MVGRAAERAFAFDVEDLQGEASDVGQAVALNVGSAVGQAYQGAMPAGPGEHTMAGVRGQPVVHLERATGAEDLLAMQRAPRAEARRAVALEIGDHPGDAGEGRFLVDGDPLVPVPARLLHAYSLMSRSFRRRWLRSGQISLASPDQALFTNQSVI